MLGRLRMLLLWKTLRQENLCSTTFSGSNVMPITSRTIGIASTAAAANNGYYFFNAPPLEAIVHPKENEDVLPPGPDQWRESDYLDRVEMYKLMQRGERWEYAQCQWLMNQQEYTNAFPNGWESWFFYATGHCFRFAKEQPHQHTR